MMKSKIDAFFEKNRAAFTADLQRLIAIESSKGPEKPGMPFGEGCSNILAAAAELCGAMGLSVKNLENKVLTADLGAEEPYLGILAHLDTVPVGEGWHYPPLEGYIENGVMYGRGTSDDKGACVAAIYAMRAASELAEIKKGCRLIMGADEECGSSDIVYYKHVDKMPPCVFSPDAEFPVYNTEKGRFAPRFSAKWPEEKSMPRVTELHGGLTENVVPHRASATVAGMGLAEAQKLAREYSEKPAVQISVSETEKGLRFDALGLASHASEPENGKNALTALIAMLSAAPLVGSAAEKIRVLDRLMPHGECDGNSLGIAEADELSGALTLNFSILELSDRGFTGLFDSRTPACTDMLAMVGKVRAAFSANGITLEDEGFTPAHHTAPDSEFIKTLLASYEGFTGRKGECCAMGGATYAHGIPGAVSFGASMPGTERNVHGPDEHVVIDELITAAKIFTQVIIDICA